MAQAFRSRYRAAMSRHRLAAVLLALAALAGGVFAWGWHNARADPVLRRAHVALPDWPAGAPPMRVALISDIHMESTTMDPARLARIVAQVNAQAPDLVLIAGDFVDGHGAGEAAVAVPRMEPALGALRARRGVVAVLGNHDYWTDPAPVIAMLRRLGFVLLVNDAAGVGPLRIAGMGDQSSGHLKMRPAIRALRRLSGAGVMLAHSPDAQEWAPREIRLLLAGHTHCGQVVLPLYGPPVAVAAKRYRCGLVRDLGRVVITTAGLGTSNLPLRFGAPPDWWLITLGLR